MADIAKFRPDNQVLQPAPLCSAAGYTVQSFQGLVFRFQAALNQLPNRPEKAYEVLESALISADQAIAEGRSAIQELRSGSSEESNLEQMLLATGRELASSQNGGDSAPSLRVIVEGNRRAKRAMMREEIYRIARELLRNAYRHAHAQSIEAELRYDDDAFLLIVRDDGKGIDPKVLKDRGRAGHWGLPGMSERAEGIGARLDIWSEVGAGTEVRLTVPSVQFPNISLPRTVRQHLHCAFGDGLYVSPRELRMQLLATYMRSGMRPDVNENGISWELSASAELGVLVLTAALLGCTYSCLARLLGREQSERSGQCAGRSRGAKVVHDGTIDDIGAIDNRNVGRDKGIGNWCSLEKQVAPPNLEIRGTGCCGHECCDAVTTAQWAYPNPRGVSFSKQAPRSPNESWILPLPSFRRPNRHALLQSEIQ